ncbi:MAG: thiamine pyrophosphate-binding protein, partial [Acidobacteria bacterium]|nr:thiamine pyrophosphate-binding protein [Acidobacteriota bacterium]
MKLSDYVAQTLAAHNARHIFAISGAGSAHLLDSVAYHPDLSYVCPHHEQAGLMAAIAYTRVSGNLGVMMTTAGPGAANAIIGVLNAWADSIPCLILSGQEKSVHAHPSNPLRMWGVQGFNIVDTVKGFTKYAALVDRPETIRYHLEKALHLAFDGRPGPVWIDIPVDIQAAQIDPEALEGFTAPPAAASASLATAVAQIRELLAQARRPVFWLGNGIRLANAQDLVAKLVEQFPAAYLTAWNGCDLLATDHPLHFGHAGVYGQRCANFVLQNCDLLIAIGTRLAIPQVGYEHSEFARAAKKVMVDIDPTEIAKLSNILDLGVEADAGTFLRELLSPAGARNEIAELAQAVNHEDWIAKCSTWRDRYPLIEAAAHPIEPGYVNSYRFIDELSNHFADNETIVLDAGTACTCSFQALRLRQGQRVVYSTGLGEMGFGLPGAIGAALAKGDGERIILISGDGSIMMNLQEMQTAVHHKLPIKLFLFTNGAYLSIKHTQKAMFGRYSGADPDSGVSCPDFGKVAAAFGFATTKIDSWEDTPQAIERVLNTPGPILCEVPMNPAQLLVPKLALAVTAEGKFVSPPLEDLSPLLPREPFREEMELVGVHPKS